jgi:hypothetical protein
MLLQLNDKMSNHYRTIEIEAKFKQVLRQRDNVDVYTHQKDFRIDCLCVLAFIWYLTPTVRKCEVQDWLFAGN